MVSENSETIFFIHIQFLWQLPPMGQLAQLHPQEDLPFFLSLMSFTVMATTIASKQRATMIVAALFFKKSKNIKHILLGLIFLGLNYLALRVLASLYFLKKSI